MPLSDERMWALLGGASAAVATILVRRALRSGWRSWSEEDPPDNPADPEVGWKGALAWAGATGMAVAMGRVLARRGAASAWRKLRGRKPPF